MREEKYDEKRGAREGIKEEGMDNERSGVIRTRGRRREGIRIRCTTYLPVRMYDVEIFPIWSL